MNHHLLSCIASRYVQSFARIAHVLDQLDDDELWRRPAPSANCAGVLLRHVTGNLRQWICAGIGGDAYERRRPAEFRDGGRASKQALREELDALQRRVLAVIDATPPGALSLPKRIQGFDETVCSALLIALTHLEQHAGQMMLLARLHRGEAYREYWTPANAEQGRGADA